MADHSTLAPAPRTVAERRTSPAEHLAALFEAAEVTGPRAVRLREERYVAMVGVRIAPTAPERGELEARLGTALPGRCGAVSTGDDVAVLWLSPDEFLVLSDVVEAERLTERLAPALPGSATAVVDLSANRATFLLEGPSARKVLEKGCPLDLHPRVLEAGTAYVTNLGRVPVILQKTGEEAYRVMPRASFADFLGRWLVDAMAEFKAPGLT
ncbi:sarcosine oxidase subunit gamma [Nocardioides sp. DS6]|uniref:Sarcosine oxidase subunit gamma n=1 Tax=Nocardioides eburneus TaxID=3231482 RepID=A0ABV3SWP8_9ACTN